MTKKTKGKVPEQLKAHTFKPGNKLGKGRPKGSRNRKTIKQLMDEKYEEGETLSPAEAALYIRDRAMELGDLTLANKANETLIRHTEPDANAILETDTDLAVLSREQLEDKLNKLLDRHKDK